MESSDIISLIALIFSIISFISVEGWVSLVYVNLDLSTISPNIYDWFIDNSNKLKIDVCNYSNRDILINFTNGYIQNGTQQIKIKENQYYKIESNSKKQLELDVELNHYNQQINKKEYCLNYRRSGFSLFEVSLTNKLLIFRFIDFFKHNCFHEKLNFPEFENISNI